MLLSKETEGVIPRFLKYNVFIPLTMQVLDSAALRLSWFFIFYWVLMQGLPLIVLFLSIVVAAVVVFRFLHLPPILGI